MENPIFKKYVDRVDEYVQNELGYSIAEMFCDDEQTYGIETSQVGIYTIQVALADTLRHHGASEGLFTALMAGQEDFVLAGGDDPLFGLGGGDTIVAVDDLDLSVAAGETVLAAGLRGDVRVTGGTVTGRALAITWAERAHRVLLIARDGDGGAGDELAEVLLAGGVAPGVEDLAQDLQLRLVDGVALDDVGAVVERVELRGDLLDLFLRRALSLDQLILIFQGAFCAVFMFL